MPVIFDITLMLEQLHDAIHCQLLKLKQYDQEGRFVLPLKFGWYSSPESAQIMTIIVVGTEPYYI